MRGREQASTGNQAPEGVPELLWSSYEAALKTLKGMDCGTDQTR